MKPYRLADLELYALNPDMPAEEAVGKDFMLSMFAVIRAAADTVDPVTMHPDLRDALAKFDLDFPDPDVSELPDA